VVELMVTVVVVSCTAVVERDLVVLLFWGSSIFWDLVTNWPKLILSRIDSIDRVVAR